MTRRPLVVLATFVLLFASSATANTIYQYTGNSYTLIIDKTPPAGATYSTAMSVTGSFEVAVPLPANLPLTDISGLTLLYAFNDGAHTHTQSNSSIFGAFNVATDAFGNITDWQLTTITAPPLGSGSLAGDQRELISTAAIPGFELDRGIIQECAGGTGGSCGSILSDVGQVSSNPGSWSLVPEPSTGLLIALGLIGFARARGRRR